MVEINHMRILIAFLVILDIYSTCVNRMKGGEKIMDFILYNVEDDDEFILDSDMVLMHE